MNTEQYKARIKTVCTKGLFLDPMYVMAHSRYMMLTAASRKFGAAGSYKRDYRAARDRVMARSYLVDRKPRDFLDAGIMVLAKSQTMGGAA